MLKTANILLEMSIFGGDVFLISSRSQDVEDLSNRLNAMGMTVFHGKDVTSDMYKPFFLIEFDDGKPLQSGAEITSINADIPGSTFAGYSIRKRSQIKGNPLLMSEGITSGCDMLDFLGIDLHPITGVAND